MSPGFAASLIAATIALVLTVWLLWRARQASVSVPAASTLKLARWVNFRIGVRRRYAVLEHAVRYVLARRDWRYRSSWILLMGLSGDGKSSLAASLPASLLRRPLRRDVKHEAYLAAAVVGTEWHFLEQGVLIDPDTSLSAAQSNHAVDQRWRAMLSDIDSLRPDRALDGIVWVISAARLLTGTDAQLIEASAYAFSCINEVQEKFAFALPVYVVVSHCDVVTGFNAFWTAQDPSLCREMVGWSSPTIDDNGLPSEWVNKTFVKLMEGLRALVLKSAATQDHIENMDDFFLFPQHMKGLQAPLAQFMETVFKPNVYETRAFCRGMYFTGVLAPGQKPEGVPRDDVAFVEGLMRDKIFAEQRLAQRVQKGVLARNCLVRGLQRAVLIIALVLAIALPLTGLLFAHQTQTLLATTFAVTVERDAKRPNGCLDQVSVYNLIDLVAALNTHTGYAAIPLSWIDRRLSERTSVVSANALSWVVLRSMECLMRRHVDEASAATLHNSEHLNADAATTTDRQVLKEQLAALATLEDNLERFKRIALPATNGENKVLLLDFATLAKYLYGKPLSTPAMRPSSALSDALVNVIYPDSPSISPALRERLHGQLRAMADQARENLIARVDSGAHVLSALKTETGPSLVRLREFNSWLSWVQSAWILSSPDDNPCARLASVVARHIDMFIDVDNYKDSRLDWETYFQDQECTDPAVKSLRQASLPPYGALFNAKLKPVAKTYFIERVSPAMASEASGLRALADTHFMQVTSPQSFTCNGEVNGWQSGTFDEILAQLREYQQFVSQQKTLPRDPKYGQPLYDQLARAQLQLAVEDSLARHQRRPLEDDPGVGLDALSQLDQRLSRQSAAMSSALGPLLQTLQQLRQLNMGTLADTVGQCARNYASNTLLDVSGLASASQLYDPAILAGQNNDAPLFDLGSTPVLQAYLDRQLIRAQVLAGYASPFVTVLKNSRGVDGQSLNSQADLYWDNTIRELNQAIQFGDTAGQVAKLNDYFLKQLDPLSFANCAPTLTVYQSPAFGNDFFSIRREKMERVAAMACNGNRASSANQHYLNIAILFNTEMAGRYPFGSAGSPDVSIATVKAFFVYYAKEKPSLETYLATAGGTQPQQMKAFVDQLDAAEAFFAGNLSALPQSAPVGMQVGFRALPETAPDASPLSNQLVAMTLTSGADKAVWPGVTAAPMAWTFGQPLSFDLQWANRSRYMPLPDAAQPDLSVSGYHAVFKTSGPWALLRLMDRYRPLAGTPNALEPAQQLLQFNVPVVQTVLPGSDATESVVSPKARFYFTLTLSANDPVTKAAAPLVIPRFPQSAPEFGEQRVY